MRGPSSRSSPRTASCSPRKRRSPGSSWTCRLRRSAGTAAAGRKSSCSTRASPLSLHRTRAAFVLALTRMRRNVISGVAGITADANSLVNYARTAAQQHLFSYNEDIPVELLAQRLCDLKQGYTQFGGLRPFGVSLLYAGYDKHYRFQLYHSDPSGNYSGWKATCIGANNGTAQSLLKQEYKDDITVEEAIGLVMRTMSKTMDSTTLGSEKRTCSAAAFPRAVRCGAVLIAR